MSDRKSWHAEKQSAFLYRVVAKNESDKSFSSLFLKLADEADKQAEIWGQKLDVHETHSFSPDLRVKFVALLVKIFGPQKLKHVLAAVKIRGLSVYSGTRSTHETPSTIADVGRSHKNFDSSGNLRAAVFGVNDGLVSTACLVIGVSGASQDPKVALLAGFSGLAAGAFSMAAGEFVSVKSQRELFEYQIGLERDELHSYPDEEAAELALIYETKGLPRPEAEKLAKTLVADPNRALDTLAREELGLNPQELGSPWGAATFSFLSFSFGGILPLIPFLLKAEHASFYAVVLSSAGLLFVGGATSLFSGRSAAWGAVRMLFIGLSAGIITFMLSKLVG